MIFLRSVIIPALLLFESGLACAQTPPFPVPDRWPERLEPDGPLDRYRAHPAPPVNLTDSARMNALIRAGNLYLSLSDAIALAIENNLDVEYQRLTPLIAEADLLRARAGSVVRGVPSDIREGPSGLGSAATGGGISGTQGLQSQPAQGGASTVGTTVPAAGPQTSASGPGVPAFDPALTGTFGYSRTNRPQTNTFITGTNRLLTRATLGDVGFQKGFLTGGTASIGVDATRQNTTNLRSDINPSTNGGLGFSFVQPLLRGFGFAVNSRYIRIAKNNRTVSDLVFSQQVISTVYAVTRLYWDLVSLRSAAGVQQRSVDLAEQLLRRNMQQEEVGTLAPIDIVRTRAELAAARRDLTVAETRLRQQETLIKDYLTRGSVDAQIAAVRVIPTDPIVTPEQEPVQPLQDLVAEARRRRPEVQQAGIQAENAEISATGSRSGLLPQLDLIANARSNALFGTVNPLPPANTSGTGSNLQRQPDPAFLGGIGTGLTQIFGARFPDYSLQLQLTVPLFNRAARADYTRDQLAIRQQQIRIRQLEKQVSVEVVNALIAVEQSRAAYQAARQSREFQEQSLEAERERLAVGASTNYQVIQFQRDLVQAESAEVSALADYAVARTALDRSVGRLLDRVGVSITEAYQGRVSAPPSRVPEP